MTQYVLRTDELFKGHIESYLIDGKTAYSGLTLEEYAKENGGAYKVITESELDQLLADFEKGMITDPQEITEERYYEMLEVLPPCRYCKGVFHISERLYNNMVQWFFTLNGKYYEFTNRDNITENELREIIFSV